MDKIRIPVPMVRFSRETMRLPIQSGGLALEALKAQPAKLSESVAKGSDALGRKLIRTELTPARESVGLRGKLLLIGLGSLLGAGIALLFAPTTGRNARSSVQQKTGRAVRVASTQAGRTTTRLSSQLGGKAQALRSRLQADRQVDTDPDIVSQRVQTEIGENATLRALPRINVNTEWGGVVYLRGVVPSERERELAEKVTRRVRGVNEVVNELNILGPDASSQSSQAVQ